MGGPPIYKVVKNRKVPSYLHAECVKPPQNWYFFLSMRLSGAGASRLPLPFQFALRTLRANIKDTARGAYVARRAMASSKADEIGRSPRAWSAACTTQASSTWAGRRIWYARPSVRWLRAPSKLCALTNERLCLPRGLRRFRRSAQPMHVAQPTNAGVGQYELRGLQGAETSAPQQEQRKSVQPDLFMHSQSSVRAVGRVDHRFSRSGMGVKGLHPSRQRLAH